VKRRVVVLTLSTVVGLAVLAGCGSDGPATPDDPTLARGQEVYNASCASCHGVDGGGGFGRKLAGEVEANFPDIEDQIAVVADGRDGTNMPAFRDRLSDEDIEAVVRYTRETLG
jgi:cytochrome c oxidase subunit 2